MDLDAAIDGTWWLPEATEAKVHGLLETDDDDLIQLRTHDPLGPTGDESFADENFDPFAMPTLPMIHGLSTAGVEVTLIGLHCVHRSIPLGGQRSGREAWRVESIVLGCWLDDPEELMSEVRIEVGSLFEWSGARGPALTVEDNGERTTIIGRTETIDVAKLEGVTVTLRTDHYLGFDHTSSSLNQVVRVAFEPEDGIALRPAMNSLVLPARDLLALMVGEYVPIRSVEARPADDAESERSLRVSYLTRMQRPNRERRPREPHEMLATLPKLGVPFGQLVPTWFQLRERQRNAVTMLLVPTHAPYLYADSHLLTAWLALEAYHSVAIGGTAVPAEQHAARVEAIVNASPPEHQGWARNMLAGKNQIGAKRQLIDIIERSGPTGAAITKARAGFVSLAVAGRQQVAHPAALDADAGARFLFLGSAIRWLLRHCLLVDLGVDQERVAQLISVSPEFVLTLERVASL